MSGRYRPGPLLPVHDYITTTRNVYSAFHQLHASRFCIIFQGDEANDLRGISAWRLDILDISNRISIDRFFKYWMVDGDYLFLLFLSSVCVWKRRIFSFWNYRRETWDFFSFEDLLWKIYSKSFLFFCLCGKWIFFFFSFCAVGEKSCIEIYGIFLSCFWIVVLYNIPCSLSSEREILLLFFSLDNRYGWLYL